MKNDLRKLAKEKRCNLNIEQISSKVKNILFSCSEYKNAKNILCYYSFGNEICTVDYFNDKSKNWYLPKIEGDNLLVCKYEPDNLKKNQYGILEPINEPIKNLSILDLIIIPALCADKKGYRLGYGKGFYDRFLKKLNSAPVKIVLTCEDLLFDDVCPESFDEKCDIIVTDKEKYKVN